jgi:hypothetical protein
MGTTFKTGGTLAQTKDERGIAGPYRRTRIRKRVQDQVDSIAEIIEPEEDEDDEGGD